MKKIFACILCALLLTGCWDVKELNNIGIVGALGLDKDNNTGEFIVTSQVLRPAALKTEGGSVEKSPIEIITTKGYTIFEAMRNITQQLDRKAFFAHVKIIVIGEQLARDGVQDILDFLARSHEIYRTTWLIIAKDTNARDILGAKKGIEAVQSTYMSDIIENRRFNSEVSTANILDFLKRKTGSEINPVAGVMRIIEEANLPAEKKEEPTTTGVKLSGTAVFKKDKLVGYLDDIETRGLNWITGKVESGLINVLSPFEEGKLIAIEIKKASSKIKPEIVDGKISFTIEVKEEGALVEEQGTLDVSKLEIVKEIEKAKNDVIENEIKKAIDKIQKEYNSDILGFGSAFRRKYPKEWRKIKDNWESMFPNIQYDIKVNAKIRSTQALLKSVKPAG